MHTHTLPHTYTPQYMYTHILKMPISAEQWRVSVGAINASRRPCQSNKRWMCWEVFLLLLTALLVSTLLPGGGWRSRSEYMNISRIWPEIPEQRCSYILAFNAIICVGYYTTKTHCMLIQSVCVSYHTTKTDSMFNTVCACRLVKVGNLTWVRPHLKMSEISTKCETYQESVRIAGTFGGH